MARKSSASSARARRLAKNARPMPDSKLDLSDIPESTDAELRRARRVGRPASGNAKQLIAIRIAPQLLRQLRRMPAKQSKPYQTPTPKPLEKSPPKAPSFFSPGAEGPPATIPHLFLISNFSFLLSSF